MKKSDKPTEYILLKAYSTGEFDTCDFVILHITQAWKSRMLQRLQMVVPFTQDDSFSHLTYSESPEGFYTCNEAEGMISLTGREGWCFIAITRGELENLTPVNNDLCGYQLDIDGSGLALYKAYDEQSSGEFYTDSFNVKALITAAS